MNSDSASTATATASPTGFGERSSLTKKRTPVKKIIDTCSICADTYNKSTRAKTLCSYCQFSACLSCWQTHFLNETQPICMNTECKREWTRKHMRENLTNVFMNTKYKKHTEDLLYEKEKTFMPATQPLVERQIEHEKFLTKIDDINNEITRLMQERRKLEIQHLVSQGKKEEELCKKTFVRACSKNECRGFLSTQWKCGICETWTCPECHENKGSERDGEHTCDPNNVASAKLISSDSRPCPKCRAVIFKIDGCDQMFCTMCHTAFSWRTGRLETNIHNPHYFEWMNRNGGQGAERNPLDVPCGREIGHGFANDIQRAIYNRHSDPTYVGEIDARFNQSPRGNLNTTVSPYTRIVRGLIHLQYVIMNQYNNDPLTMNQHHRINYMRNKMSEEQFKKSIQMADKQQRKENELMRVFQLLRDVVTDILHRFYDTIRNERVVNYNILNEVISIVDYVNECLKDISFTYNSVQFAMTYDLSDRYNVVKTKRPRRELESEAGNESKEEN